MRFNILLPSTATKPIGGFRVHYEFANFLANRQHDVCLIHPRTPMRSIDRIDQIKSHLWMGRMRLTTRSTIPWFAIDQRVRVIYSRYLKHQWVPQGDCLIATGWQTAKSAEQWPRALGEHVHIVYDYEYWQTASKESRSEMASAFRGAWSRVATSPAIELMLREIETDWVASCTPGINTSVFKALRAPMARDAIVGIPLRSEQYKGTETGLEALGEVVKRYPRVRVMGYGHEWNGPRPKWLEVHSPKSDREMAGLLNQCSIVVIPSYFEGFGLPGLEAMACGASLVTTDNGGASAYTRSEHNALVVPVRSSDALQDAVSHLLSDDALRYRLAYHGVITAGSFAREDRWAHLEKTLLSMLAEGK